VHDAVNLERRLADGGGAAGFDAAALVDGHVDDHAARLHQLQVFLLHQAGRLGAGHQHGPDHQIGDGHRGGPRQGLAILHRHAQKDDLREAVQDASLAEISRMERRLVVIVTVAQIAPLLGLLGTVLGMVEFVMVMQSQGALIQSADVMGGLMKALIATAAGLTVAIPCYAAFNLLVVKVDRIVLDMEKAASEIVAFITAPERAKENAGAGK